MSGHIEFQCPLCQHVTRVPAAFAGKQGKCPGCQKLIEVPGPDEAPSPVGSPVRDEDAPGAGKGDRRPCPSCGELIQRKAAKCRFCGEWLDARVGAARRAPAGSTQEPPLVLRIWGALIMALNGLSLALNVVSVVITQNPFGLISVLIGIVFVRLGLGLWRGERVAVAALGVLGGLGLLGGLFLLTQSAVVGLIVIGVVGLIYGIPVAVGIQAWDRLH